MAEYIDQDFALAIIQEKQKELCPVGRYGRSYVYGSDREMYDSWEKILDAISSIPSADVSPVVHGRWINESEPDDDNNVTTECSNCFHSDTHAVGRVVPFCWFCGAKMDEEEKK